MKKNIAREFLLLITVLLLGLLAFAGMYFYNSFFENNVVAISISISGIKSANDTLEKKYNEKIFNNKFKTVDELPILDENGIAIPSQNSVSYFSDSIEYKNILNQNKVLDSLKNEKRNFAAHIISRSYQTKLLRIIIIVLFILIFLIRYLFYGITLSVDILKQK